MLTQIYVVIYGNTRPQWDNVAKHKRNCVHSGSNHFYTSYESTFNGVSRVEFFQSQNLVQLRLLDLVYDLSLWWWPWPMTPTTTLILDYVHFGHHEVNKMTYSLRYFKEVMSNLFVIAVPADNLVAPVSAMTPACTIKTKFGYRI